MEDLFSATGFRLAEPWWLLLLPVVAAARLLLFRRKGRAMMFPGVAGLRSSGLAAFPFWTNLPAWLVLASLLLALLSLARPQAVEADAGASKGIDIVLALDISDSMAEPGFGGRSRLEAAKDVALRFVASRPKDRFGLVLFRGKSFTQCPLTADHRVLGMLLGAVTPDAISDEGTAIGSAILVSTNRLRASVSPERLLVLLTDGEHNTGEIGPVTAAELAVREGVRVYAIGALADGAGKGRESLSEKDGELNEGVLRKVARITGGRYFRASDRQGLREAFREIGEMQGARFGDAASTRRVELYPWLLFPAWGLLAAGLVLGNTRLMRIP